MKKILGVLLVLMVAATSLGSVLAATSIPGGPFASSITIQNLGAAEATVSVQYVTSAGAIAFTSNHNILIGDVLSIYVPTQAVASGEYSVVLSSNQPISAISNFSDSDSGASYAGADEGSPTWFIPGVYDDYYSNYSEVYAQNVAGTTQDITLSVYAPGSATPVYTNTKTAVPSLASVNWGLKDLTALNINVPYSAKVTAAGNIVAMTNYYGWGAIAPQLYSYNGFSHGDTKFYLPSITNFYYGWRSSINIQNVSSVLANVNITYSNGTTKDYAIQPNSGQLIYIPVEGLPSGTQGLLGATVTSDQNVAVVVNQSNDHNRGASYTAISSPTKKVAVPLLMNKYYNESSALTCQNVGTEATVMTATFSDMGTPLTSGSIPPNGIWSVYLPTPEFAFPIKYLGSAVITASQNIACVVQSNFEDAPYNTMEMDAHKAYTGINQ